MRSTDRIIFLTLYQAMYIQHTLIAKQGKPFIILAVLLLVAAIYHLGWLTSLPVWILPAVVIYMFRDPQRHIPPEPLAVVSPADGHIVAIDEVRDNYLDRDAVRIRLRMNPLGSFTTRSPIEGKVVEQWYITDRAQLRAGDPAFAQWVQTDEGEDLVIAIHPGMLLHQRPSCYVQSGERIGQGQRCGFISFGARMEIFLPSNTRVHVEPGQSIVGGETTLAEFAQ